MTQDQPHGGEYRKAHYIVHGAGPDLGEVDSAQHADQRRGQGEPCGLCRALEVDHPPGHGVQEKDVKTGDQSEGKPHRLGRQRRDGIVEGQID